MIGSGAFFVSIYDDDITVRDWVSVEQTLKSAVETANIKQISISGGKHSRTSLIKLALLA